MPNIINLSPAYIDKQMTAWAYQLAEQLSGKVKTFNIYGVPRGGIPPALSLKAHLERLVGVHTPVRLVDTPEEATVIVDDLVDSGATKKRMLAKNPKAKFIAVVVKTDVNEWIVFPWEASVDASIEDVPLRILQFSGREADEKFTQHFLAKLPEIVNEFYGEKTV